jgi:3-phosphoshikimate 1-carboxyvinyltransferase
MTWLIRPASRLYGTVTVPGDKSISHRGLIHAALAAGTSRIAGFLHAGVTEAMIRCVRDLGVEVETEPCEGSETFAGLTMGLTLLVHGGIVRSPTRLLDCGNSGATIRMLLGALAGRPNVVATLTGSPGLRRRPMRRVIDPLRRMGAEIAEDAPPVTVRGRSLHGIDITLPVASAQVKAALLLAALHADGPTTIREPGPSRDHSERLLRALGVSIVTHDQAARLDPLDRPLPPFELGVPGDISSAAFLMAAAALAPDSEITVRSVGVNPTRTGMLDALTAMGVPVEIANRRQVGEEPVADVIVQSGGLRGVAIDSDRVVRMIDEFPVFAVVATQAEGQTVVREAAELRVKESDRIGMLVGELRKLGAQIEERLDGFVVEGPTRLRGAVVDSHSDHRLAMSLAVAGLIAEGETIVTNAEAHRESFPNFVTLLRGLGASIWDTDERG